MTLPLVQENIAITSPEDLSSDGFDDATDHSSQASSQFSKELDAYLASSRHLPEAHELAALFRRAFDCAIQLNRKGEIDLETRFSESAVTEVPAAVW